MGFRAKSPSVEKSTSQMPCDASGNDTQADGRVGDPVVKDNESSSSDVRFSSPGGRRRSFAHILSFPAMLAVLLGLTVFILLGNGVADPDIWWHLRNAEYLLNNQKLPRIDTYSFTVNGRPWMNHEWLAEIPFYLAWRASGLMGIQVLTLIILESIVFGLLFLCQQATGNIKASILACYLAVFLVSVSFGPRTILFGYGYLLILLAILERFRARGRAPLWLIPPLFCLWVNTHGSWSLGLIVFGIIIAGGLIEGQWLNVEAERWSPSQLRKLCLTMVASVAALFINPYGYHLVLYPLDLAFRQKLNVAHVAEWVSVDFHDPRGKIVLLIIIMLLLGALLSRYRWKLYELGLVLFGLYSGLTYIRFLFLAAILITPLLAKLLNIVPRYQQEIDQPLVNAVMIAVALAYMVHTFPTTVQLSQSVAKQYPSEILPYLKSQPPSGPVLNFYLWGGYLGWYDKDLPDFVDSRVDIFEYAGVFQDYIDLLGLKNPPAILDKYGIRYVLFPPSEPLTYVLQHDPNWRAVFNGKLSILFERVGPITPKKQSAAIASQNGVSAW